MKTICSDCGRVEELEVVVNEGSLVCKCGREFIEEDIYPNMQISELLNISDELYESCKKNDKENRKHFLEYADDKYNISNDELIQYIAVYENLKCKYPDNVFGCDTDIIFEFESIVKAKNKFSDDNIKYFGALADSQFNNKFRKSFIIISASIIEMYFNDFFNKSIIKKLGEEGGKIFLNRYNYTGVKERLDIIDAFIDKPLKIKMDEIKKGFFDKWSTLRSDRNTIIHSNKKYVSMKKTNDIKILIDEGHKVFLSLISETYSKS